MPVAAAGIDQLADRLVVEAVETAAVAEHLAEVLQRDVVVAGRRERVAAASEVGAVLGHRLLVLVIQRALGATGHQRLALAGQRGEPARRRRRQLAGGLLRQQQLRVRLAGGVAEVAHGQQGLAEVVERLQGLVDRRRARSAVAELVDLLEVVADHLPRLLRCRLARATGGGAGLGQRACQRGLRGLVLRQLLRHILGLVRGIGGRRAHQVVGVVAHHLQQQLHRRIGPGQLGRDRAGILDVADRLQFQVGQDAVPGLDVILLVQRQHLLRQMGLLQRIDLAGAEYPVVRGELRHRLLDALVDFVLEHRLGEQRWQRIGQRRTALAPVHVAEQAQFLVQPQRRIGAIVRGQLDVAVDQGRQVRGTQRVARLLHQIAVKAQRAQAPLMPHQRVEVLGQRLLQDRIAGEQAAPLDAGQRHDLVVVEMLGLAQHQVAFEVVVQHLRVRGVRRQAGAELRCHARQQQAVELAEVRVAHLVADRVALIQAEAHRQRHVALVLVGDIHRAGQRLQPLQHHREVRLLVRRQRQVALRRVFLQCGLHLGQVAAVAPVATGQPEDQQCAHQQHADVGRRLQQDLLALQLRIGAGEARLLEQHVLEQPLDEERAALRAGHVQARGIQAERARHRTHHAVDRRAFLRARGEIGAAQQQRRAVLMAGEHALDELPGDLAQGTELLRERQDRRAPGTVALAVQAIEDARVEPVQQQVELVEELFRGGAVHGLVDRERHAPDLAAQLGVEVVEEFGEAGDQVALGEHQIGRHADAQVLGQFVQPLANRQDVLLAAVGVQRQQVGQAHRHDHAVDRTALAVLAQQVEEFLPCRGIGAAVGILRGVAAGGVEEHGLVGEPPVAVAGAADAADRFLAELVRQRKIEARVLQQRALAGARRTDHHVPRQRVQVGAAAAVLAQRLDRLLEAALQLRALVGGTFVTLAAAGRRALLAQVAGHLPGLAAHAHLLDLQPHRPDHHDHDDHQQPHDRAGQRLRFAEAEIGTAEPDQQRQQQQADEGDEQAGFEQRKKLAHDVQSSGL